MGFHGKGSGCALDLQRTAGSVANSLASIPWLASRCSNSVMIWLLRSRLHNRLPAESSSAGSPGGTVGYRASCAMLHADMNAGLWEQRLAGIRFDR